MQQIQEALQLNKKRNEEIEGDIDLRIRAEKLRLLQEQKAAQESDKDSYDGEEGDENEESDEEEEEPKIYEINDSEDTENVHDLINIQIGGQVATNKQQNISAVQSSIDDSTEMMGTLMSNRK